MRRSREMMDERYHMDKSEINTFIYFYTPAYKGVFLISCPLCDVAIIIEGGAI